MSSKIVVEEKPGLYVSELFSNLHPRNKKPKRAEGQPPPPFNPAPLQEFLRVMGSAYLQANRRSRVNMQGDEIAAMIPYLDLCEFYRKKDPATIAEEYRSSFTVLRAFHVALEHLILRAIDITNLIDALSFTEEAQSPEYYRTTILKHICIPIDDLQKRLNEQITGQTFQETMRQVHTAFSDADSLRVHDDVNRLLGVYNKRMEKTGDRKYITDIRNEIAAHTNSDIDVYIEFNKNLDVERIRSVTYDTLDFVKDFLKTSDPLIKELQKKMPRT